MEKIRIMVVDDHPAFRDGLSRLLQEEADFEVVATPGDGEQALEMARKLNPDVIVMDISMPKMNGIEATKLIKAEKPEIAVLLISAYGYQSYVLAALKAGAAGYLLKNAPLQDIVAAIRSVYSGEGVFDMQVTANILRRLAAEKIEKPQGNELLQPQDLQILSLAVKGLTNKEIAAQLDLSEPVIQSLLSKIFKKLRVGSRTEAVLQGLSQGWLKLEESQDNESLNRS